MPSTRHLYLSLQTSSNQMFQLKLIAGNNTNKHCGSVDRVVASDARGPRFESSHGQDFKLNIFAVKKRPGTAQFEINKPYSYIVTQRLKTF